MIKTTTKWFTCILTILTMFCITTNFSKPSKCLQHMLMIDVMIKLVGYIEEYILNILFVICFIENVTIFL